MALSILAFFFFRINSKTFKKPKSFNFHIRIISSTDPYQNEKRKKFEEKYLYRGFFLARATRKSYRFENRNPLWKKKTQKQNGIDTGTEKAILIYPEPEPEIFHRVDGSKCYDIISIGTDGTAERINLTCPCT